MMYEKLLMAVEVVVVVVVVVEILERVAAENELQE
jgi:hypothetical protein